MIVVLSLVLSLVLSRTSKYLQLPECLCRPASFSLHAAPDLFLLDPHVSNLLTLSYLQAMVFMNLAHS